MRAIANRRIPLACLGVIDACHDRAAAKITGSEVAKDCRGNGGLVILPPIRLPPSHAKESTPSPTAAFQGYGDFRLEARLWKIGPDGVRVIAGRLTRAGKDQGAASGFQIGRATRKRKRKDANYRNDLRAIHSHFPIQ
jgi:hypothetical protein